MATGDWLVGCREMQVQHCSNCRSINRINDRSAGDASAQRVKVYVGLGLGLGGLHGMLVYYDDTFNGQKETIAVINETMPFSTLPHAGISPQGGGVSPYDPKLMPAASPGGYQRYREMTIDEMLLENRVLFLIGEINYQSAMSLVMRMLHLSSQKKDQDIHLYINSPGGSVDDTLAIYDTMQFLPCDIATYCIGRAMSGAAVVLAAGSKEKRFILPHAQVMIHQPYGGVYGQTSDVEIQAEQILKKKATLNNLLAELTGQTPEQIEADSERDKFFDAEEAHAYGLVDEVVKNQATDSK